MVEGLITGGQIADGTGAPLFAANIAMSEGRLALLPSDVVVPARRHLDATGLVVAPGFVDIHSHNDLVPLAGAGLNDKISQGVTTEVIGNCGFSPFPVSVENHHLRDQLLSLILPSSDALQDGVSWASWAGYAEAVREAGCHANIVGQVGHLMLRSAVMGMALRAPTADELASMQRLLARCLDEGASGLSFGLMYHPSSYAALDEIRALCEVAAARDTFVSTHLRGYDEGTLIASIQEFIDAAEATGVRLQLSHLAPAGKGTAQLTEKMLELVEAASERGVDLAIDRYPYDKGMSRLGLIFPKWVLADGTEAMLRRLSDPAALSRMGPEIDGFAAHIGYEHIRLVRNCDASLVGKSLRQIAEERNTSPAAAAAQIMRDSRGLAGIVLTLSTMETQYRIIRYCRCMVGSDGIPSLNGTHPRTFGTFARVLGPFVRSGVLTLSDAVRKMTSLPAERIGLKDRGVVKNGAIADLVIFDPATVSDRSTFDDPYACSAGIVEVFVGGESVYKDGAASDRRPGAVLTCRIDETSRRRQEANH